MSRAFLAIALPLAVRTTLSACRRACSEADPAWQGEKWVSEENLHVTLRFLGEISGIQTRHVVDATAHAVAGLEPFRLRLDTVRAVPRPRSASYLWVSPSAGTAETARLAETVDGAVAFLDFRPDNRGFAPHVTLCRARRPRRITAEGLDAVEHVLRRAEERATTMSVREVTLFASTLTPRGPVYDELARIPFGV